MKNAPYLVVENVSLRERLLMPIQSGAERFVGSVYERSRKTRRASTSPGRHRRRFVGEASTTTIRRHLSRHENALNASGGAASRSSAPPLPVLPPDESTAMKRLRAAFSVTKPDPGDHKHANGNANDKRDHRYHREAQQEVTSTKVGGMWETSRN